MELTALINARPADRRELPAWYGEVIATATSEGLSVPDLANRLGCSNETVYSWRRRLRGGALTDPTARRPRLLRVKVARSGVTSPDRLEVRLQSGRSILVPNSFDAEALVSVIGVLEQC